MAGVITRIGAGRATRYAISKQGGAQGATPVTTGSGFRFSEDCRPLLEHLRGPLTSRKPVTYDRFFLGLYEPNQQHYLPADLADRLFAQGRARGQQPAGTYARRVLEQLLIDLSWHSSRLEGNRMSLLDTEQLFARGQADEGDIDALMLLNHKQAIEFIVDAGPQYGIVDPVVRNIQSVLMQGLLPSNANLGQVRSTVVTIADSVYVPLQAPQLLAELLSAVLDKARNIRNPVEAAFFLWIHIAYLQPFEDGNKRTSRLCANLPLMLQNCAPLSFLDVEQGDYALAMLAVYEQCNVSLAVELFVWTYRRSIEKYAVLLEAMGAPDQFRQRYREQLGEAVRNVVTQDTPVAAAVDALGLPPNDVETFEAMLRQELEHLEVFNCARFRLGLNLAKRWIDAGRPGLDITSPSARAK
ncbi:MAG TPA: Fic family protein [Burkholderiaceae bacterium]